MMQGEISVPPSNRWIQACSIGDTTAINSVLHSSEVSEDLLRAGFLAACRNFSGHKSVGLLLASRQYEALKNSISSMLIEVALDDAASFCAILQTCGSTTLASSTLLDCFFSCRLGETGHQALLAALQARCIAANSCTKHQLGMLAGVLQGSAHWGTLRTMQKALARALGAQEGELAPLSGFGTTRPNADRGVGYSARRMASVQRESVWLCAVRTLQWLALSPTLPAIGAVDATDSEADTDVAALVRWLKSIHRVFVWRGFACSGNQSTCRPRRLLVMHRRKRRGRLHAQATGGTSTQKLQEGHI